MKLRKIGKIISGFLFVTLLTLTIIFLTLSNFTSYNNLKPSIVNLAKSQLNESIEQLSEKYVFSLELCKSKNETAISMFLKLNPDSIKAFCSKINEIKSEELPELIGNITFDEIYFRKYDCSFFECIKTLPDQDKFLFVISKQSNDFFKKMIIIFSIATFLTLLIFIIITENWPNRFKSVGLSLVFVGASYFFILIIKGYITEKLITPLIDQIFNTILNKLLIVFIFGLILTATGFILDLFSQKKK